MRKLPDSLRINKRLFKKIVFSKNPQIEFTSGKCANATIDDILKTREVVNLISNELNTTYARMLLSNEFIEYTLEKIKVSTNKSTQNKRSLTSFIKRFMPASLKGTLGNTKIMTKMDFNLFAFRAYIICKMNKILSEDAAALNHINNECQ